MLLAPHRPPGMIGTLDRRSALQACGGGLLAALGLRAGRARGAEGPLFVACRADPAGSYFVSGFDGAGGLRFDLPLPDRGHAMAFAPSTPHCVVFARRPGQFAVVLDYAAGVALHRIDAPAGRHFFGHGVFSPDGRYLFTTENDNATGEGRVGIRDAADGYRVLGEFPSHGVGPHELVLLPDGQTLAVANGGILTSPEFGRDKLNLASMAPSLAYLDLAGGRLRDDYQLTPALHQLSIRHLAVLASGAIAIAMQYEGDKQDQVPLVGIHDGGAIRLLEAPAAVQRQMRHYGGSVAVDQAGSLIAVSAPRGNLVTFWDGAAGRYLGATELADGCGVAPTDRPGEFMLTSGTGRLLRITPRDGERQPLAVAALDHPRWDNHLRLQPKHTS